jgi:tetratricopeptide (TPR) repeat protein
MRGRQPRQGFAETIVAARAAANMGSLDKALALAFTALKRRPQSFEALFLVAVTLQRLGRNSESIAYYQRAIRVNDRSADAYHNLGYALLSTGRMSEAAAVLRRALTLRPDYAPSLDALGFAVAELGDTQEALALLERSLELDGESPSTHCRLGNLLLRLHRYDEARARFETALARSPDSSELLDGLGVALSRMERSEEAIAAYRRALDGNPAYANTASNLGKTLLETGDIDEAMMWLDRAIELEPGNGSFYLPLVTGGSKRIKPAHVEAMKKLGSSIGSLPHAEQIDLHFALGNVFEREGRIEDAFRHFLAGNTLKRSDIQYDEPGALAYIRSLEVAFGNPLMEELRGCGNDSERSIFVVGMPRSGSTLVEQLLAAHPAVSAPGEISVLGPIVRDAWPAMSASSVDELRTQVRRIGDRYLRETDRFFERGLRLTDKTLEHLQLVPLIHVMLPNARIIHINRADLDTCFSCFATSFADHKVPFSYDLRELGTYYAQNTAMMQRWRRFVPPDRLLDVDYETLVDDFEAQARRIVAFCGLPWDPACLAFYEARRPVRTASNLQVRQPLYRNAVGRGQPFIPHLGPLIAALTGNACSSPITLAKDAAS